MPAAPGASAPGQVRMAGLVVGLQGLAGIAFAVALLVRAVQGLSQPGQSDYPMAGLFVVLGAAVLGVGVALVRGRRWGRTPAVVLQLLLIGTAWYAVDGASSWVVGVPLAVVCIAVLVLLFRAPAREWAIGAERSDRESDAPRR